jgi:sodium transport system permease protein
LFTIFILPLLLYPLLGMSVFQIQQFLKEHASNIRIVGTAALPLEPKLIDGDKFAPELASDQQNRLLVLELVPDGKQTLAQAKFDAEADIRSGKCDAVVYFPPDFAQRLADFRSTLAQRGKITAGDFSSASDDKVAATASNRSSAAGARRSSKKTCGKATCRPRRPGLSSWSAPTFPRRSAAGPRCGRKFCPSC